ncbi:MAG: putative quinol monooxygenase, partial [Henriciella sp.]
MEETMIGIVAELEIRDGKQAEFEGVAKDLMAKVKANEPGCLTYQLYKKKGS